MNSRDRVLTGTVIERIIHCQFMLCSLYYQVNINKEDPWTNILNYKQYSLGPDYDTNNNNEKGIYVQISTSPTISSRLKSDRVTRYR